MEKQRKHNETIDFERERLLHEIETELRSFTTVYHASLLKKIREIKANPLGRPVLLRY